MISDFIKSNMKRAKYKKIKDGTYWGEIKDFRGVWANAKTLSKCRDELREVLEDWIILKIQDHQPIKGLRIPNLGRKISYA